MKMGRIIGLIIISLFARLSSASSIIANRTDEQFAPPIVNNDAFNVFENLTPGSIIGQVNALDPEGDPITFQIIGGDPAGIFIIDPVGFIILAGNLDSETAPFYFLTVEASDLTGSGQGTVVINVSDVNEAPSFSISGNQTILEDAGPQLIPGWAGNFFDGDWGLQTLSVEWDINDPAFFSSLPNVDLITGDLTYTVAPDVNGSVSIGLHIVDDGGIANGGINQSGFQYFAIDVTPVNDSPDFLIPSTLDILEDQGQLAQVGFASSITDGGDGTQQLSFVVIPSDPTVFIQQPVINPVNGDINFEIAPEWHGAIQIDITLQDDGGVQNGGIDVSVQKSFLLSVISVNDAPSFQHGPNISVSANSPTQTFNSFVTNLDDGDPLDDQTFQFNLIADNPGLFIIQPYINQLSNLIFTPQTGMTGMATITIQLMDNGGTNNGGLNSNAQSFTISVGGLNLPPSFVVGPDIVVDEDSGFQTLSNWATTISDGNDGTQNLEFIVSTTSNAFLFDSLPAISPTGTLTFMSSSNKNGYATIKVTLKDDGGTANGGIDGSTPQYFTITIEAVNDFPSFEYPNFLQLTEDFDELVYQAKENPVPADEQDQVVNYSIYPDPATVSFLNLEFNPINAYTTIRSVPDQSGIITFVITADDGRTVNNTYQQQLYIEVQPANDPPVISNSLSVIQIDQNSATIFQIPEDTFMDPEDGTNLTINVSMNGGDLPVWIAYDLATRTLTFLPDESILGSFPISITATDTQGQSVTDDVEIRVFVVTAIRDTENSQIKLFPNPVADKIHIRLKDGFAGDIQIVIFDGQGKEILRWHEIPGVNSTIERDISSLKPGVYFLKLKSGTFIADGRIIKN